MMLVTHFHCTLFKLKIEGSLIKFTSLRKEFIAYQKNILTSIYSELLKQILAHDSFIQYFKGCNI